MAKKVNKVPRFFRASPDEPIGGILAAAGNIAADKLLRIFSNQLERQLFGTSNHSPEERFRRDSAVIAIQKQKVELARAKTQQLKADGQLKLTEIKVKEKEIQLEKAKQHQTPAVSIQRTEMDLHIKTEVISGALELVADSGGVTGSAEQQEATQEWQDSLPRKIILVLGQRGSGKTATAAKFGEYVAAVFGLPVYWVSIPEWAQELLPSWIKIVDSLEQVPNNCFVLIDETGLAYLSLNFASKRNVSLRQLLMLSRQKNWTVVFCGQSSRDMDESIVRQINTVVFKEPCLNAASERPEIRPRAIIAQEAFRQVPKNERCELAMVFDESGFEGFIRCSLPSFWSEELSTVYGRLNTAALDRRNRGNPGARSDNSGAKLLSVAVSDDEILALRRRGFGIERISKALGCSTYRVRQCLTGQDPQNEQ